ncbi:MAG: hypothetical protein K0S33_4231 [Bacteroidetes bacterium]|jgi:hypothetical protein|nr:hypothetical protein [Bacteroidota bacterium]
MKKLTLIALLLLGVTVMKSQTDFDGVKKFAPNNFRPILENNEIKGYFVFNFLDKENKKEYLYGLTILDNNMKQTHYVEVVKSKNDFLVESSFNGERFCFAFMNAKEKTIEYQLFDKQLKAAGKYMITELSSNELAANIPADDSQSGGGGNLLAVTGKGFVRFGYEREKGTRMVMEMFDNTGKKVWDTNSGAAKEKKSYEGLVALFANEDYIVSALSVRPKLMSQKDMELFTTITSAADGKEIARISNKNFKFDLVTSDVTFDKATGVFTFAGEYYDFEDDKKPKGFALAKVDVKGNLKKEVYSSWVDDISKVAPVSEKGKMDGNRSIFIHKVITTADGKTFVVGEQFKKAVSALGVASTVLGGGRGGTSAIKAEIYDMIVFEYDNSLKLTSLHVFEKNKSNFLLPSGMGMQSNRVLGYFIKMYGGFDYAYQISGSDKKLFNVAYVDYDKDKEEGSSYTIGNIAYTKDAQLAIDKIKLKTKPTNFYVFPAKPGYTAIFEYYKKQKKLTARMEKLNF